ncbi:MAG: NTP transferase domain-containing protein, partial [Clostridiales bacterium]|nr:NTP transferase domain-containing protein [Clostridiales bacterium]
MNHITAVILAAGKGVRMKSKLPKVLHPLFNKPMLAYVLQAARESGAREQIVVVGYEGHAVRTAMEALPMAADCRFVNQEPQLGTGHAMQIALPGISSACDCLLVLCGDTPLLSAATLSTFLKRFASSGAAAAVLSCQLQDPHGYGRVLRGEQGALLGIVEEKDAFAEQKAIREINTGIYCFSPGPLREVLATLTNDNAQGEYYLTDTIAALQRQGLPLEAICLADPEEIIGINERIQLAAAGQLMQRRINHAWMREGVTIIDPGSAYIDADVS